MSPAMLLTKHIYQFSGIRGAGVWGANVFMLLDRNITLVDTGFKGRYKIILKQLGQLGYPPSKIANIIVTHHHADHIGSLSPLKRITRSRVFAHPADAPYIEGRLLQPGPRYSGWLGTTTSPLRHLWTTAPVAVDILIEDGDELPILGGIKVVHTPGHTPGSICLLLRKERLLIAGDVLSNTLGLRLPSRAFTADLGLERQSVKKIAGLDFDIIGFGHGPPLAVKAKGPIVNFANKIATKQPTSD